MPTAIAATPVPLTIQEDGSIRVSNTRVTLDTIHSCFEQGRSAESIAASFPTVPLADIYAVLTYCLRNRSAVAAYLERREAEAEAVRKKLEPFGPPPGLRERLLSRRGPNGARR